MSHSSDLWDRPWHVDTEDLSYFIAGEGHDASLIGAPGVRSHYLGEDLRYLARDLRYLARDLRYLARDLRYLGEDLRYLGEDLRYLGEDGAVYVGMLLLVAVVLTWPVPRLLPRWKALRTVPGPALLLWQSVSLAGVLATLLLAPLLIMQFVRRGREIPTPGEHLTLLLIGLAISGFMLVRLALQGHRIGTRLRRERRRHAAMLDLLSAHRTLPVAPKREVRVVDGRAPAAYCIPGRNERLVITASTIDRLAPRELDAVVAHEQAHLLQRHDLIIEFFTVLHTAVPQPVRSTAGMTEARLLVERLADLHAVRTVGAVPLARALYSLARGDGDDPEVPATAPVRLLLLADDRTHRALVVGVTALSALVLAVPIALATIVLFFR